MKYEYTFTVFTPTYNRAQTLHRVYNSLRAQTFRDFEWLVVDDGSTDETEALIRRYHSEADFPIRYIWQENAGSGAALNRGVAEAQGELFLTLDSDDACVETALERFKFHWDAIPVEEKDTFSAVTSLAQNPAGEIIGSRFPFDPTDSDSLEIRIKYRVTGEKWGFHRTTILRNFPFPEIKGVKRIPDSTLWNRIAMQYKTRFVNEPLLICYPSPDSRGALSNRIDNAVGARLYYKEFVNLGYPMPAHVLLRNYANYVRYSFHAGVGLRDQLTAVPSSAQWAATIPVGYAFYLRDRVYQTVQTERE